MLLTVQNRQATIDVQPSTSTMIIKALKELPRDRKKEKNIKHHGSVSMSQIVDIARQVRARSLACELAGTVREVLGTCVAVGCSVDGQNPRDVIEKIQNGEVEIAAK